jgi:excisionase family DNA binding protein
MNTNIKNNHSLQSEFSDPKIPDAVSSALTNLKIHLLQEVLNVSQAAEFLSLSPSTVYTYIRKRKIPFVKRNGAVWLLRSKLMEWLHEGERKTLNQMSR